MTVTDPAGHWKKYTLDVVGNLVKVTEPDPALGNVDTNYTYNLRQQLTGVSMPRGGTTQSRTFNYDLATGRLSSAVNPESGTTSYTYNGDGSIATRTDARNQHVEYTYDTFQRVTQIRRYNSSGQEQTCQRMDLYYDTTPSSFNLGQYTQNGWGRPSAAHWGNYSSCTGGDFKELYSYNTAGKVTKKRLRWSLQGYADKDLEALYTYNTLGQLVSTQYPNSGPTFTYSFDSMARPNKLTSSAVDWVKDVVYNTAGQLTSMKYTRDTSGSDYYTESRQYNVLGQMTQIQIPGVVDRTYTFSSSNNDGRITQMADAVSGETVQYQYDSLKRLISASTTGPQWGQSFGYDGFGNLLTQTVTKGSAPSLSVNVDGATNRITTGGYSYDSNGNLTAMPNLTLTLDVENRLVQSVHSSNGTESYAYDPSGQRVWKQTSSRSMVYFYGVDGTLLGTYGDGADSDYNVYFAGKQIWAERTPSGSMQPGPMALDRLGSVVSGTRYFPYGDEPSTTTQDRVKFATYYRDSTSTLDYARNRYYARTIGRFTTPDPYIASGGPADPQSWNRYSYVQNDPVNFSDPEGLMMKSNDCNFSFWGDSYCPIGGPWFGGYWWNGIEWEYPDADPISSWMPATQAERKKRRGEIDLALAAIVSNVPRDNDGLPLRHWPAAIQMVDMCSTINGLTGGYELHVTYQVISELGTAMSGQQLAGFSITESFLNQTGNLGDLNLQAATWVYPGSIGSDGQFIDILNAGGNPLYRRAGTALQEFTATGWFGIQPLEILGFGNVDGVNFNTYARTKVTVNGQSATHSCN